MDHASISKPRLSELAMLARPVANAGGESFLAQRGGDFWLLIGGVNAAKPRQHYRAFDPSPRHVLSFWFWPLRYSFLYG
jgi:hypothetical protein